MIVASYFRFEQIETASERQGRSRSSSRNANGNYVFFNTGGLDSNQSSARSVSRTNTSGKKSGKKAVESVVFEPSACILLETQKGHCAFFLQTQPEAK